MTYDPKATGYVRECLKLRAHIIQLKADAEVAEAKLGARIREMTPDELLAYGQATADK